MADLEKVMTNRDKYLERMKSKYPEREFSDDEELFGQINDDYDSYDNEIASSKEREKSFSDLFTSDPRSAAFLTSWRKGGNPAVELVRMYGDDFLEEMKDPARQEELAQASKEYAERISKERDFEEQYQSNISETLSILESLQSDEGRSDEEIDSVMELLMSVVKDGILGKFSRETIEMGFKALNHSSDVQQAKAEGEIRGRNAKIEERLKKSNRNDGTASLDAKNSGGVARSMPEMGALGRYDNHQNIWERGGERRIPVKR